MIYTVFMLPDYKGIGSRIREAREYAGYTQAELADLMGETSQDMISKIERGATKITLEKLYSMAGILNTPITTLLGVGTGKLSSDDIEFLDAYRKVPARRRRYVMDMLRVFSNPDNGDT